VRPSPNLFVVILRLTADGQFTFNCQSQHELIVEVLHFEKYAFTRSSNCLLVILAPQVVGIFTSRFTSSYDNPASTSFLIMGRKNFVEEVAHLVGDLLVEGPGSDRRLFLLFSGFLLGLELFVVFIADTQLGLGKALVMILGSIIDRISIARRTMSPCDTRIESNITPACLA
jgi:hypothetical protein